MNSDAVASAPAATNREWYGLDEDGLRLIVRRRENSEIAQVSVTTRIKRQDEPHKVSEHPLAFIAKELGK